MTRKAEWPDSFFHQFTLCYFAGCVSWWFWCRLFSLQWAYRPGTGSRLQSVHCRAVPGRTQCQVPMWVPRNETRYNTWRKKCWKNHWKVKESLKKKLKNERSVRKKIEKWKKCWKKTEKGEKYIIVDKLSFEVGSFWVLIFFAGNFRILSRLVK